MKWSILVQNSWIIHPNEIHRKVRSNKPGLRTQVHSKLADGWADFPDFPDILFCAREVSEGAQVRIRLWTVDQLC